MPMRRALLSLALLYAGTALAHDELRQHGAHVHGLSDLEIAIDGAALALRLEGAADNFLGFERSPRDAAEAGQVEATAARLRAAEGLFALPTEAECTLSGFTLEPEAIFGAAALAAARAASADSEPAGHGQQHGHAHGEHGGHDHGHDHGHAHAPHAHGHGHDHGAHGQHEHPHHDHLNVVAEYQFECADPAALSSLELRLIESFPRHQRVRVAILGPSGQSAASVEQPRQRLSLR